MKKNLLILCIIYSVNSYSQVVDDLNEVSANWLPFSDQVMGGVSEVNFYKLKEKGLSFYRLKATLAQRITGVSFSFVQK